MKRDTLASVNSVDLDQTVNMHKLVLYSDKTWQMDRVIETPHCLEMLKWKPIVIHGV